MQRAVERSHTKILTVRVSCTMSDGSAHLSCLAQQHVRVKRLGRTGGVLQISLDNPKRLNALSMPMIREMAKAVDDHFGRTDKPRLVILKASGGKAFCAGGDVKAIADS